MKSKSLKEIINEWVVVNELDVTPEDVGQLVEDIKANILEMIKNTP